MLKNASILEGVQGIKAKLFQQKVVPLIYGTLIFNSRKERKRKELKKNPLKNLRIMQRLNPYAGVMNKAAKMEEARRKADRQKLQDQRRGVSLLSVKCRLFEAMTRLCNPFLSSLLSIMM